MANVASGLARHPSPPLWPALLLGACATLATVSLCQGFVDVVIPVARGEEPFGFLYAQTERFGPGFLAGYVFLHNLGLACLVPGYGFLAARFERRKGNRFLIGVLLAGAVACSLVVALELILQSRERFDLPMTLALFAAEAAAVLAVAVAAARELRGFIPTRRLEWSLVTPLRRLGVPLAYAFVMLLLASLVEAWAILHP